ncbi:hypothetical protein SKAU_G00300950 [Synaphobranchus kaupii]|uniref:Uncharacterized protein n=1 Tax=Synaphobranchus kaupii TaxID=118154 RepID=A0A9Q1EVS7_SYNKA|nr:hypothetical protein SKAU_G00300950 [Synaphobranchus kaupii]
MKNIHGAVFSLWLAEDILIDEFFGKTSPGHTWRDGRHTGCVMKESRHVTSVSPVEEHEETSQGLLATRSHPGTSAVHKMQALPLQSAPKSSSIADDHQLDSLEEQGWVSLDRMSHVQMQPIYGNTGNYVESAALERRVSARKRFAIGHHECPWSG